MSRKTTFNERVTILEWINKGNHSYSEAAEHFNVSYQQARYWALKDQAKGFEVLVDNRGHRKPESELTDLDKANLWIRQLESQSKDEQLLEAFIKKYQEL
ncbi:helix-turn-helix domain-containing protein [Lactiplantibacillus plantarum]|uniref:helix-turn-helix domain-containing protein n=1 Tax=Lactiplantibacillus plantarum TaxID=1590 RepID=UPI0007B56278|nr:helix-turn-helix domain-containing protein [Lactiplantibacillus plantarum]KZU75499.1 transposase [Lactiplantibacillus plantarum]MCG0715706.1 transposase [Lactiplantibacillus plantarum]UQN23106.1 helix-turn-helix domain containing protein [Lactiplantibacillus plantarum]